MANSKLFIDYKADAHNWITLSSGEFYPDILANACELYSPVLVLFGQILKQSESSSRLFMEICNVTPIWMRIQLCRVFKKYVSPDTPVEMLKKKSSASKIGEQFGGKFRRISEVQAAFSTRPIPDEALCALLWEYKDRGKKGYDLTERFFEIVKKSIRNIEIIGPERAGKDVLLGNIFKDYPTPKRPVDFILFDKKNNQVCAVGLARYDSDRGGTQEDDRTGGYANCVDKILTYCNKQRLKTKVIFLNDGPGLLLGSMWNDYANLEKRWKNKIMVLTLRMVSERLTEEWLRSETE